MAQKNFPILFAQGATYDRTFTVTLDGDPWDFTGYIARMQVRQSFDSPTAVLSLTSGDGISFGAGTFTISVDAVTSEGIPAGSYVYDLEVEYEGVVTRLLPTASFTVTPGVTRD